MQYLENFSTLPPHQCDLYTDYLGSQFSGSRERVEILPTFPRVSGDADLLKILGAPTEKQMNG
jgi:hypothetical protein